MRRDPFLLGLLVVTVAGAIVRVLVAATEPPHFDESFTAVHSVQAGVGALLTTYAEPNNHIFYSLLAHATTALLGPGPFALRLPALLAGIALVPTVGVLARRTVAAMRAGLGSGDATDSDDTPDRGDRTGHFEATTAGLVAAVIVAGAPPLIAYSANARGYTLAMLLLLAQLLLGLRLIRTGNRGEPRDGRSGQAPWAALAPWAAWALAGALAIWTVPTAAMGVAFAAIWLAALRAGLGWRHAMGGPALAVAAVVGLSVALYAPVLGQRGFSVERFTAPPVRELVTTLANAWTAGLGAPLIAMAVGLAVVGLARRPRLGTEVSPAIGLLAVPVAVAALGRIPPFSRTYLFLSPVLALLAGIGAARLTGWFDRRSASDPGDRTTPLDHATARWPRSSRATARSPVGGRATRAGRAAVAVFGVLAIASAAAAQTREAWGEDPPGPPYAASVAAIEGAVAEQRASGPPGALSAPLTILTPAYTVPQVEYAARRAAGVRLEPGPGRSPVDTRAHLAVSSSVRSTGPGPWLLVTRADVSDDQALRGVGLDPATVLVTRRGGGVARAVELR